MDDIELIKSKINIVDLLSEYLQLKKAGANFKALCPFHDERTPSFMVSPERGIWHCFGCDKGGDHFKFLMEKEGIEFVEALEILAQKAGVTLSRRKGEGERVKGKGERLYEANNKAQQLYHHILTKHNLGGEALEYLRKRGLTKESINHFGLGFAPKSWETLTKFLLKRGFSKEELITSGLCVPSQKSLPAGRQGCYDRFRERITFPLIDVRGNILGFSGRILGNESTQEPKYINTPQTPIFDKSSFLFGLNTTKGEIRQKKEAILVEGELDMILSFQEGVKNIAASKGTALTENQVELLKRYADTINLCFDTDLAGDEACRRGIEIADKAGLNIKVVQISGGKDPGEVALKNPQAWQKMVSSAVPIYDYYLDSSTKRFGIKSASSKKAVYKELAPIIKKIADPIVKDHYIQKLAATLQVKEELLRNEVIKAPQNFKNPKLKLVQNISKPVVWDRKKMTEEYLAALLLHIPKDHTFVPGFPETIFTTEELKQIYVMLTLYLDEISFKGGSFKISKLAKELPKSLEDTLDRLYLIPIDDKLSDRKLWQREVEGIVLQLKKMLIKSSLEKLSLAIKNAQEFDRINLLESLNKKFRDLSLKLKNL